MSAAADAAMVLARASLFDTRIRSDDAAITAAWAEAVSRWRLDRSLLLDAVTAWYSEPRDRVIQVGDVIRTARDIRQQRALADTARAITGPQSAAALPSGTPTHLGALDATGTPIREAYLVDDAIDLPCPRCDAQPGQWCGTDTTDYRIPCVARLRAARNHRKATA